MEKISYSKINAFKQCPRKYNIQYNFTTNKNKSISDEIRTGIEIHSALERYFLKNTIDPIISDIILNKFIINLKSKKYEIEKNIEAKIDNILLHGKIDYLHFNELDNEYLIVDFKTGNKIKNDFYQLRMYMIMLSSLYFLNNNKELNFKLIIYSTKDDNPYLESYKFENLNDIIYINLKSLILKDIHNMNSEINFKKRASIICENCNVKNECFAIDRIDKENILEESSILFNSEYDLINIFYEGSLSSKKLFVNFSETINVYDYNLTSFKNYISKQNKNLNDYLITPGNFYIHKDYDKNIYSLECTFNMIYSLIKIFNIEIIYINDENIRSLIETSLSYYNIRLPIETLSLKGKQYV